MRILSALLLAIALHVSLAPAYAQSPDLLRHFEYDQKSPLDIKESGVEQRGDISINDMAYASRKGGGVRAYLVIPKGKGPFAAVIWGHWYMEGSAFRNRKEFLDEAVVLAHVGVISLLPDGPIARPGHVENNDPLSEQDPVDLVHSVVDIRRGADLLLTRRDADAPRLAHAAHVYTAHT